MLMYNGNEPLNLDKLIYWIKERYSVRLNKESGVEKPWSLDQVFQETYFCNVHREADRVTKGIRQMWYNRHAGFTTDTVVQNMIMARFVNKIETLESLGWPWTTFDPPKWRAVMSKGGSWGSAYIVSTNGRSVPKHEYIGGLLRSLWQQKDLTGSATTLAKAHVVLMGLQGLGSFMAAQIIADLKNTEGHELTYADDFRSWCAHGPGSLRGLAWVLGKEKVTPTEFKHHMPWLHEEVTDQLHGLGIPDIHAQDLQNCLCEFDKYMRVSTNCGRSKRRYNGT